MREPPAHVTRRVLRVRAGAPGWQAADDTLAGEEPLEIRLLWEQGGAPITQSIAVTMRTPGDDFELAIGFLRGEGILADRDDFVDVSYCMDADVAARQQTFNVVTVTLRPGLTFDLARLERHFYTTSSCGVCGKAALEALEIQGCAPLPDGPRVAPDTIRALPARLRAAQDIFGQTGGLHAAGLFDADGQLVSLREDVGRHNALDKVIGEQTIAGRAALPDCVLLLSGRASFELLQKALAARIPLVAAVGAPSSLAAQLAEEFNITLVGFTRAEGFNVYTGEERICSDAAAGH